MLKAKNVGEFFKKIPVGYYVVFALLLFYTLGGIHNYHEWNTYKKIIAVIGMGGIAMFVSIYYLIREKKAELFKVYLPLGFVFGLIMMLLIPVYCVPDEHNHLYKAYDMSNAMLGIESDVNAVTMRKDDAKFPLRTEYKARNKYEDYFSSLKDSLKDGTMVKTKNEGYDALGYQYFLPAVGITLGRLLGLGSGVTFLLGRLMNLILYTALVALAIKIIPKGKMILFAVALLPMSLQEAASFSFDAMVNGTAAVIIAITVKLLLSDVSEMKKYEWFLYAICCVLLMSTKHYANVPIALLPLAVLPRVWKNDKETTKKILVILTITVLSAVILYVYKSIVNPTDPLSGDTGVISGGNDLYTIGYLLHNPRKIIEIIWRTFNGMFSFHLMSMIGEYLGWFNITVPSVFTYAWILLLVCSALAVKDEELKFPKKTFGVLMALTFLTFAFVNGGMLLITPITSNVIFGVQGRYYLVFLPLFLFLLKFAPVKLTKNLDEKLILLMYICNLTIMFEILYRL